MDIKPESLEPGMMHKLMIGCVVPRPIAWVSSQSASGQGNLAPFSYFNAVSSRPAALSIVCSYQPAHPSHRKDTLRNILETGEFVVNVVTEMIMEAMNQSATIYPEEIDEFAEVGITATPSLTVQPPRVAESPINFECTLHTTLQVGEGPGSATMVIGYIKHIHIRDELVDEGLRVDIARLQPIGRLAGNGYCYVRELFDLERQPYVPPTD